jgi:hypothetical protein
MTDDRHVRIWEDGSAEPLPTVHTFFIRPRDPEEDVRLETEYVENNRRVGRMLREKDFGAP